MNKLDFDGESYSINKKKSFKSMGVIPKYQIKECIKFALNMTFNKDGEHRDHRTGGQARRKNGQIFANTFQGKISEYAVYNEFKTIYPEITEPDLETYDLGIWDDTDFAIGDKKLSIKSTKSYSELLLLETKDWDSNGNYIPNKNSDSQGYYDYFILVRIEAEIEKILRKNRVLYNDTISQKELDKVVEDILSGNWSYDIPGFITHDDLVEAIRLKNILPQGSLLGKKTKMDATNYYIQSGDLRDLSSIKINNPEKEYILT